MKYNCPICERDLNANDEIIVDASGEAIGCNRCTNTYNAFDWLDEETDGYALEQQEYWGAAG